MTLSLFTVKRGVPKWYVSSDVAWAEKGSPIMQSALEIATCAIVEMQEQHNAEWWARPLLDGGRVKGVLVVRHQEYKELLPPLVVDVFRASSTLAEPMLRHWQKAEQSLWQHMIASVVLVYRKLTGSGYLTWKVIAIAALLVLAILTLWPVNDMVKADLVIEGKTRWVITAPDAGFIATVAARPGDTVHQGQVLATLDNRDLLVELAKDQSAADQADGHFRKAMGEVEAADSAQAVADLHQAQAQLALVNSKLTRSVITAPMNGIVVSGDWVQQIGSPVENGKEMFQIAEDGSYRVILHVLDSDIARVHAGQMGHLRLISLPSQTFDFSVTRVTAMATVQSSNNDFRVEAKWVGSVPKLSPGMQGVGKIVVGRTNLMTTWTRPLVNWLRLKVWGIL
jgi:multidrug resistance efflux pump